MIHRGHAVTVPAPIMSEIDINSHNGEKVTAFKNLKCELTQLSTFMEPVKDEDIASASERDINWDDTRHSTIVSGLLMVLSGRSVGQLCTSVRYRMATSYPRVEYSSKDSTVTIITCQSSLHANAAQFLQEWIVNGARRELTNQGRDELGNRLRPLFDETLNAVNDEGTESVKKPDGGLDYYRDFRTVTVAAIEVGVSEKYEKLNADVTRWMDEFLCRTGILFSLNETPRFSYPRRQDMNAFSVANDLNPFHNAIVKVGRNQPFGPYPYRGHNWFGSLDSAFIEIFRRDSFTGVVNQLPV
ncbi:hypothetical protein V1525DRAFT_430229 [Lipomyces kononenkoae]|uniref:Uncharacterized protein n=1 Tax=Lipomyces kononenkoae TaxID=34357 RepID=A0ACC3T9C3_LIPKO